MVYRVLYTDSSLDSNEAKSLLDNGKIEYQEIFIADSDKDERRIVPELLAPEGTFPNIENIRWYAHVYSNKPAREKELSNTASPPSL